MIINKSEYRQVNAGELDDEIPFRLSWGPIDPCLVESLNNIGQLSPLIIWPDNGRLKVLCGKRRMEVMSASGAAEFNAFILPDGVEADGAFKMALEDNLAQRLFNEAEKVMAVHYLSVLMDSRQVMNYLKRLGVPARPEYLDRYKRLYDLGTDGLDALASGALDPETAEMMLRMTDEDRQASSRLLNEIRPGKNKRRQIIQWLDEIRRRDLVSVEEILRSETISDILFSDKLSTPQKEKGVREEIKAVRYPNLTALREEQQKLLGNLKLKAKTRLIPPPDFEGLDFRLEVDFADRPSLVKAKEEIERILEGSDLDALLELG